MKFIPMRELGYRFDEVGNVMQLNVGFERYDEMDSLNTRLSITTEDINEYGNASWNFENLTKERAELVARRKLRDWVMMMQPDPVPEPEEVPPIE